MDLTDDQQKLLERIRERLRELPEWTCQKQALHAQHAEEEARRILLIERYKATLRTMVADDFVAALIECGWIAELPEMQRDELLQEVRTAFERDRFSAFLALDSFVFDSECIYGSGPGNLSYYDRITEIAQYSEGLFTPTDIVDEPRDDGIFVSFRQNEQFYECMVRYTDYFQKDVLDMINQALSDIGVKKQFIILPPVDQCMYLVFISPETYMQAERQGLIPPPGYF
jgi:hypothetical protein